MKLGAAFAIIGGSMTVCGLMAWHLATRDNLDLSGAKHHGNAVQAATMQGLDAGTAGVGAPEPVPLSVRLADHPAVRYALAMQENDCDTVIATSLWMTERLHFVRRNGGGEGDVQLARQELCRRLADRRLENAQWGATGVEDRYVFMPGSSIEVLAVEDGRADLERDAKECVVFRVSYPAPERSLRDANGQPVRTLEVRVWVSREGYVLKASVHGDAEVDSSSFAYDWGTGA